MDTHNTDKSLHSIIDEKYDTLTSKIKKILNFDEPYDLQISDNSIEKLISIYQKNKLVMEVKYELIGVYDANCNLFTWSWGLELHDKSLIENGKKIKNYKKKLEMYVAKKIYSDAEYLERLLYYISNNTFLVNPKNISILEKACVSLTKTHGIIKNSSGQSGNISVYYLIVDILRT